jgi:hypothetical protein
MEKISWTDRVRNEELLHRVKEERKAKFIGHISHRNSLFKCVIEGKIEVTRRRGRRCKQLLMF